MGVNLRGRNISPGMNPSRGLDAFALPIYEPICLINAYGQSLWKAQFSPHDAMQRVQYEAHYLFDTSPMKTPSRLMPAAPPRKMRWWGWPILAAMLSGLAYWVYCQPFVLLFLLLVGVLAYFQLASEKRARKRLAASRQGETICDFARSFDRQADTWIIRAVYEELARFLAVEGQPLPVRREDRCEKDLKIDPEDWDDLARDIAYRARRSMDHSDKNPVYGEVKTVADMVTFFEHQPKLKGVEPTD